MMYDYLKILVRVIEPCNGGYITNEVRVYADAWIESFFDGRLSKSYQSLSQPTGI